MFETRIPSWNNALAKKRQAYQHSAAVYLLFRYLDSHSKLTGHESIRVCQWLDEKLTKSPAWMRRGWELNYELEKFDDPSISEVLTKPQVERLNFWFQNHRRLEQLYRNALMK